MIFYRAHEQLLKKAIDLGGSLRATVKLGFAGSNLQSYGLRPNYDGVSSWVNSPSGKLSDFLAGEWSQDGGQIADDVREFLEYERETVSVKLVPDQFGCVCATPWVTFSNSGTWEPHLSGVYTWGYVNIFPPENKGLQYPYVTPVIDDPYWGGCETCKGSDPWYISPGAGLTYATINTSGVDEEALGASMWSQADWFRLGGSIRARYAFRIGNRHMSGDYAVAIASGLFASGSSPWSSFYYTALSKAQDDIKPGRSIPLTTSMLAFPELYAATWNPISGYISNDPGPERVPFADLNITNGWTNSGLVPIVVKSIGYAGYNTSAGRYDLLAWGGLDSPVTVEVSGEWKPASFRLMIDFREL